jgi:hypothetical protein
MGNHLDDVPIVLRLVLIQIFGVLTEKCPGTPGEDISVSYPSERHLHEPALQNSSDVLMRNHVHRLRSKSKRLKAVSSKLQSGGSIMSIVMKIVVGMSNLSEKAIIIKEKYHFCNQI